jgi:uncharacterized Tic20 family protein
MLQIVVMDTPPPLRRRSPPPAAGVGFDATERQWAIGIHLSALLDSPDLILLNVLGPLIIWHKEAGEPYWMLSESAC